MQPVLVTPAESGQKLLQFLKRRLGLSDSILHRFIRQGQVRVNGKRCKPFLHVQTDDWVRIPPHQPPMAPVAPMAPMAPAALDPAALAPASLIHQPLDSAQQPFGSAQLKQDSALALPPLVGSAPDLWVFNKPAGLAIHGGSKIVDSLAARLQAHYPQADFRPTPVHRLDKDTSGLILVATSYTALRRYAELFQDHQSVTKEYLAIVQGQAPWVKPQVLEHKLLKTDTKVIVDPAGKLARLTVVNLKSFEHCSLLHITLHTGRTHQIRVQLAHCGFPILGDSKYGKSFDKPKFSSGLKLHASNLTLESLSFKCLPSWKLPFDWRTTCLKF